MSLEHHERRQWVEENGDFLTKAFDQFISETSQTLEGMSMDDETMALSKELVTTLRDTSELLDGLVATTQRLRS